ncbi:MAG: NADH-quinone oxidoreductase subunit NuoG [Pseudomonadota bacterium]
MPKVTINGQEYEVPAGATVLQAAHLAGIEVPYFCYHPKLAIAGNCRMCLVEIEGMPKLAASCAQPVMDNMVVHTRSEKVRKAQEGVMEFLLINHPLDCPICDQGGECDLQDQAMAYGRDRSRYTHPKRAVADKHMGPLIRTFMNRCIHCTRCVRFATDIAGVPELGTTGRGEHMEIVSYLNRSLTSELSGNVVDVCPVGALTSRPYSYKGRPWELSKTGSIDVLDAVGSNIRVDAYGAKVMRILPRLHEGINEEWISDKSRYACDGLLNQRLDTPYVRRDRRLIPATWDEAFAEIEKRFKGIQAEKIAAIAGDLVDVEAMAALKDLLQAIGSPHYDCRQRGEKFATSCRAHYLFNTSIAGIEDADVCLLVGTHPRYEAPLINARIRKSYLQGGLKVARIGTPVSKRHELTYPVEDLGAGLEVLQELISGKHPFAKVLQAAKNPMLIVGSTVLRRKDAGQILSWAGSTAGHFKMIRPDWNGFNVLHTTAAQVGGLDIGFVPGPKGMDCAAMLQAAEIGKLDVLWLLGADEIPTDGLDKTFVIYQGHHGDAGAAVADVILPGVVYTEKSGTYVNTEGRVQRTEVATRAPGDAREDWKIIRALSDVLDKTLSYDTLEQLRERMIQINPIFASFDEVRPEKWLPFEKLGDVSKEPLAPWSGNFYMTDSISRHSVTMAKCSQELLDREGERTNA